MSKSRTIQERNLRRIIKEMDKDIINFHCWFFPLEMREGMHHILPKSQFPEHIDNPDNLIPVGTSSHWTLTFGSARQIMNLPRINEYLRKMKSLDSQYFERYCLNKSIDSSKI